MKFILLLFILISCGVYKGAGNSFVLSSEIGVSSKEVRLCGLNFSSLSFPVKNFTTKKIYLSDDSDIGFILPNSFESSEIRTNKELSLPFKNPILPDIPIVEIGKEFPCAKLENYHERFKSYEGEIITSVVTMVPSQLGLTFKNLQTAQSKRTPPPAQVSFSTYEHLIIYDSQYTSDVFELGAYEQSKNIKTKMISINQLPGYNATESTPIDCQGDYLKECYHYWGDEIEGVSQRAIPSLKGFHRETKIWETYDRVSFIPGLIRAYLRFAKREYGIKSALLVGSGYQIPGMYSTKNHYSYTTIPSAAPMRAKLGTDLFYMVIDKPLDIPKEVHAKKVNPNLWTCELKEFPFTRSLKNWCEEDEKRYWPDLALTAYRWSPFYPQARITNMNLSSSSFSELELNDLISVGRLVTQEDTLGHKDDVISDYLEKIKRWDRELPLMKNNSILSIGGNLSDYWIFTKDEVDAFRETYGSSSEYYISESFVGSDKCSNCSHKTGEDMFSDLWSRSSNLVAMQLNGHGGHRGVQAPYSGTNEDNLVPSRFESDNHIHVDKYIHKKRLNSPQDNTIKAFDDSQILVGHIFANSCTLSSYELDEELSFLVMKGEDSSTPRSFAENLVALKSGGAVNTYLNNDVGWGGSDSRYNAKFSRQVGISWDKCERIGEAVKRTVFENLKSGSLGWQILNRVFLGSPVNTIARLPAKCIVIEEEKEALKKIQGEL